MTHHIVVFLVKVQLKMVQPAGLAEDFRRDVYLPRNMHNRSHANPLYFLVGKAWFCTRLLPQAKSPRRLMKDAFAEVLTTPGRIIY
jgi:hypothetical protein